MMMPNGMTIFRSFAQHALKPFLRVPTVSFLGVVARSYSGPTMKQSPLILSTASVETILRKYTVGRMNASLSHSARVDKDDYRRSTSWTPFVKSIFTAVTAFGCLSTVTSQETTTAHCSGTTVNDVKIEAKIGAALFALWSVLHIWVPLEGFRVMYVDGIAGAWKMMTGGYQVPHGAYKLSPDAPSKFAQTHLFLNFVIDVGGYGVLGFFVANSIWTGQNPWFAYTLGVCCIGIADLAFLFLMVVPGVIELNAGTLGGPIIWFLAVAITPFGLPW